MYDGLLNRFEKDGYVVLEDFLDEDEVEELRNAGRDLIKNIPPESQRSVFSSKSQQQTKDRYFLDSGDKVSYFFEADALDEEGKLKVEPDVALNKVGHALHWLDPVFRKHTFSEKVKETCFQLGLKDPVIPQSMYIYKNPGSGSEVKSHQDATYLHTDPNQLVGFWIALDDATLENGCLWFAPGSHRSGVHRRLMRNPDKDSTEYLIYNAPAPIYPASNFTAEPVKKGSCVLIHGLVVHRSENNKSAKSRNAYTFHVVDLETAKYSTENWLQPPPGQQFPSVYKN